MTRFFLPVVLLLGSLIACGGRPDRTAEREPPIAVATARVQYVDGATTFEAGGVVQARTTAVLTARILAPVREVRVAPGTRVRAGDTLVVLDADVAAAQARSASAAVSAADQRAIAAAAEQRAAEAGAALARASYERIASLHARKSATAQELDNATAELRAAEARAAAAGATVQGAASQRDSARGTSDAAAATAAFAVVRAPFDGVVAAKLIEPGNMAAPGTPLVRLEDTRVFRLEVRVDESRIGALQPGHQVAVLLDGAADGEPAVAGTIDEIARAADADTRAFLVKIVLPARAGIHSGVFGRARFVTGARRALRLPDRAVVRRGQITSVFVADNGVARLRLVRMNGDEVLAGLSDGEIVVIDPPSDLVDGRGITVKGQ